MIRLYKNKIFIFVSVLIMITFVWGIIVFDSNMSEALEGDVTSIIDSDVLDVSVGNSHTLMLLEDKKVYSTGSNTYGQLGTDSQNSQRQPIIVSETTEFKNENIQKIFTGEYTSFIVDENGFLFAFGKNNYGQLGTGLTETKILVPEKVQSNQYFNNGVDEVVKISSSNNFTALLLENGNVLTVGYNFKGELGTGDDVPSTEFIPVDKSNITDKIIDIATGASHTVFLTESGSVYGSGNNDDGQIGLGEEVVKTELPTKTLNGNEGFINDGTQTNFNKAISIAAGRNHTLVLTASGTIYSLGGNEYGQLGNGDLEHKNKYLPIKVVNSNQEVIDDAKYISASYGTSTYINVAGIAYNFGENQNYGLGIKSQESMILFPQKLDNGDFINDGANEPQKIVLGVNFGAVLSVGKDLYTFGDNAYGQLGNGSTTKTSLPTEIYTASNPENFQNIDIKMVSSGVDHTLIVDSNGVLYASGSNAYGQLGIMGIENVNVPTKVNDTQNFTNSGVDPVIYIKSGNGYSFAVTESGKALGFGKNDYGQLGINSCGSTNIPTLLSSEGTEFLNVQDSNFDISKNGVVDIAVGESHTVLLTADGSVYAMGNNVNKQLGLGFGADTCYPKLNLQKTPKLVESNLNEGFINDGTQTNENKAVKVEAGQGSSSILTSSGNLYTFGSNWDGNLGLSNWVNETTTPSKVNIPGETGENPRNIIDIAGGYKHTLLLLEDGTVYGFGSNENGQLGLGLNNVGKKIYIPEKIINANNYINGPQEGFDENKKAMYIFAGGSSSIILTKNQVAYGFGENRSGQLGNGTFEDAFQTTQISSTFYFDATKIPLGHDSISIGGDFTYLFSENRVLYSFGGNSHGQLSSTLIGQVTYKTIQILTKETLFLPIVRYSDIETQLSNGMQYFNEDITIFTKPDAMGISRISYKLINGDWKLENSKEITFTDEGEYEMILESEVGSIYQFEFIIDKSAPNLQLNGNNYSSEQSDIFSNVLEVTLKDTLPSNFEVYYHNTKLIDSEDAYKIGMSGKYKIIATDIVGNQETFYFELKLSKIKKYNTATTIGFDDELEYLFVNGKEVENYSIEADSGEYEVNARSISGNFYNQTIRIDVVKPKISVDANIKTEYMVGEQLQDFSEYITIVDERYDGNIYNISLKEANVYLEDVDIRKTGKGVLKVTYSDDFWNLATVEIEINIIPNIAPVEDYTFLDFVEDTYNFAISVNKIVLLVILLNLVVTYILITQIIRRSRARSKNRIQHISTKEIDFKKNIINKW